MMEFVVEHLLVFICIIIGINSCWGLVVASQLREISFYCHGRQGCSPPQIKNLSQGITVLSIALLAAMGLGSVMGASLVLELLLVYNIFHLMGLIAITYNICKFWRED